jgi:hypothetical protein
MAEIVSNLALNAFNLLVSVYPYHPILWSLYSVNRYLRTQKPTFGKEVKIWDYHTTNNIWFAGDLGDIRDVFVLNDELGSSGTTAILGVLDKTLGFDEEGEPVFNEIRTFYDIPREWCRRIIGRRDNAGKLFLHLLPFEFCCRQILRREGCGIVQCRSICIDPRYYLDKTFFHVGCGDCFEDVHDIYSDVSIYVGLKRLNEAMKKYCVKKTLCEKQNVCGDMMFMLGQYPTNLPYNFLVCDEKSVMIGNYHHSGENLKHLLLHILVCCNCAKYLEPFLDLLYSCIITHKPRPLGERQGIPNPELVYHNGVPCVRYILDGNFDIINESAYDAPTTYYNIKSEDICKKCIDVFMSKYLLK